MTFILTEVSVKSDFHIKNQFGKFSTQLFFIFSMTILDKTHYIFTLMNLVSYNYVVCKRLSSAPIYMPKQSKSVNDFKQTCIYL